MNCRKPDEEEKITAKVSKVVLALSDVQKQVAKEQTEILQNIEAVKEEIRRGVRLTGKKFRL
jgi:hypothetical protein